jgi:hypothetical protein
MGAIGAAAIVAPSNAQVQTATIGRMSMSRACHVALTARQHTLVLGGFAAEGRGLRSVERFDSETSRFHPFAELHEPRIQPLAHALADGRILALGGEWQGDRSTAEVWDGGKTFRSLGATQGPRNAAASELLADGRVFICGGSDSSGNLLRSTELFDPATNKFERLPDMNVARAGHTATRLADGTVLIVGGGTESSATSDVELFDPATSKFSNVGRLRVARFKHGIAQLPSGDIIVVGGSNARAGGDPRGRLNDCERFDVKRSAFVAGPELVQARYKLATSTVTLEDGTIVVAGGGLQPEILRRGKTRFELLPLRYDTRREFMAAVAFDRRKVLITGGYDEGVTATASAWVVGV